MTMFTYKLCFLYVFLNIYARSTGQMCGNVQNFDQQIYEGKRSSSKSFWTQAPLGLLQCIHMCRSNSMCLSINFVNSNGTCELISTDVNSETLQNAPSYLTVNAQIWPHVHLGNCENHMCSQESLCESLEIGYRCNIIGCYGSGIPNADPQTFNSKIHNFGEAVEKPCKFGYYSTDAVSCLSNGSWSVFTCHPYQEIPNCRYLKDSCNTLYSDGEYWLYPPALNGAMVKLYCGKLDTDPTAYITLVENNFSSRSIYLHDSNCSPVQASTTKIAQEQLGYTNFQKIAFAPRTARVLREDFTFTWTNYTQIGYGISADCLPVDTTCSLLGRFEINLEGTGFLIQTDVIWVQDNHDAVMDIYVTENREITGVCGKGCAGCKPESHIVLEADPFNQPQMESATRPICTQ
ncbi:hypothetical protein LOTGIDRAFT_171279 [Lottia gigantea]|uniref:GON domain-containing protein n=1 Tax=Lottia gigantea TaxID=225164 RepID=V4B0J4_LOTGI|nr:hypothetical protein LOTGIDRAFT_171279 [Lottia gigantea]ESP03628.1 hypothetical protein LOTGIDRAFT_171279 [Lottia gigantea]